MRIIRIYCIMYTFNMCVHYMRAQMSETTFNPFFLFNEKILSQVAASQSFSTKKKTTKKKKKKENNTINK